MVSSILPPEEMKMTGDLASNWDNFRAEFEDYSLASGLDDKSAEVQAATLQRVMGSKCRHMYKHNLGITVERGKDAEAILNALESYFIVPKSLRAEMLKRIHSSHVGGEACYRQARDTLY